MLTRTVEKPVKESLKKAVYTCGVNACQGICIMGVYIYTSTRHSGH